jgi:hypothetical protein
LNHLGERWWEFRNIQVLPSGSTQFDAEFQPFDLIRNYTQATWTNQAGQQLRPDFYQADQGQVLLVNRSQPIEQGLRYNHVLSLHPAWVASGKVSGCYSLDIPAEGARLYVTIALSELAAGSDGVTFRVIAHGGLDQALPQNRTLLQTPINVQRNMRTCVVDLSGFRGSRLELSLEVEAGPSAYRDWVYLLEAYLVPMSRLRYDFIDHAPGAAWWSSTGALTFGVMTQPQGEVSKRQQGILQNGFVYGGDLLLTHPTWRNDGYVEGRFRLPLPPDRCVFRAEVGFDEGRPISGNGVGITVRFVSLADSLETVILPRIVLSRMAAIGEVGLEQNAVTSIAVPIPDSLRGQTGDLILHIDADSSADWDTVWWPLLRLTAD